MNNFPKEAAKTAPDIRGLILRTSLKLFSEKGFFNTSVHDIRREANISIGSIYNYFKNKEAIARAIYDDLVDRLSTAVFEIRADNDSCRDRCCEVIRFLFNFTETSPEAMQYILYARHREFMPLEKPICSSLPFEMIKQIVQDGINSGEINRSLDPIVATTSLFGGAMRLIHLRLDDALEQPLFTYFDQSFQCAWKAVND